MRAEPGIPHHQDLAECRVMLRHGSRTFHAASFLLPRPVRRSACALYAFCRLADDAVDLQSDPVAALASLRERLSGIYGGTPWNHAADRALAEVVRRHAIPEDLLAALLEGFHWDATQRRYEDLPALRAYGVRVAGTVGMMMALLMGVRRPDALARACDLGVAMQLTNIARDVGEDARAGRIYLPLEELRREGIDPDSWLMRPAWSPALGSVVRRLLEAADGLYARSAQGVAELPAACRPGINAARMLYREIGMEVHRRGFDSVSQRAVVSPRRKASVLARAVAGVTGPAAGALQATFGAPLQTSPDWRLARVGAFNAGRPQPPLPEAAYLVDAVSREPAPREPAHWWDGSVLPGLEGRMVWLVELFERLEQRSRLERSTAMATASRRMSR